MVWNEVLRRSGSKSGSIVVRMVRPLVVAMSTTCLHAQSGRITRMLLADVSGHGELVSQVAIGLRNLMRRNVNYVKQTRFVPHYEPAIRGVCRAGWFCDRFGQHIFRPDQDVLTL